MRIVFLFETATRMARQALPVMALPVMALVALGACAPTVTETESAPGSSRAAVDEIPVFEAGAVDQRAFVAPPISAADFRPVVEDRPLRIVATVGQIGDLVTRIGGEHVQLSQIVPGADDPHLYVPSPGDVTAFSQADVIFYNGLFLEGQMGRTFEQMSELGIPTVPVTAGLDPERLLEREYSPGEFVSDPHVWFDPQIWSHAVDNVHTSLTALAPQHAPDFDREREMLERAMTELEEWARLRIASVPEGRRVMVTSHDAFGYFGRRFGLEVVGLQGLSTEAEAGLQDVERLVDFIVEREIPAVFVEASVSPEAIRAVAEAVRARGGAVRVGGELFSDTPGVVGTDTGTYPGMLIWNVATVTTALGGEAASPLPPTLAGYAGYDMDALVKRAIHEAGEMR